MGRQCVANVPLPAASTVSAHMAVVYCGLPKTNHALKAAVRAFKAVDEAKKAQKQGRGRKGKAN